MNTAHGSVQGQALAAQVRQHLVEQAALLLDPLLDLVQERLSTLMDAAVSSRDMQLRRDAWMLFQQCKTVWRDGTRQAWLQSLDPVTPARSAPLSLDGTFELLGTEVLENKIIASRMVLNLMESAAQEINDLRKRLKFLNNNQELDARDLARPEVLLLVLVEQWGRSGLSAETWQLVGDAVQQHLTAHLPCVYAQCNAELIAQGILPTIGFGTLQHSDVAAVSSRVPTDHAPPSSDGAANADAQLGAAARVAAGPEGQSLARSLEAVPNAAAHRPQAGTAQALIEQIGRLLGLAQRPTGSTHAGAPANTRAGADAAPTLPVAQASAYGEPSAQLLAALARQPVLGATLTATDASAGATLVLQRVASQLRQQSSELKQQARSDNEKAVIELVTLMFQAILQEDRIASGIRVWFARLQMPVLRVALSEPDFFSRIDHPARQLIDHMGSCVMGFDAGDIANSALEAEIKRIVQVVEQYPETGERVFRNVYAEFLAFLKQHLAQRPGTQQLMGVAEQLEHKETLTIQYTIELRDQIEGLPLRPEIRDFLFKVWAEVMALATLRHGARHEETLRLKKTASDLVWSASAKTQRAERARVIAGLPDLLQRLRAGMGLLGMEHAIQESHIRIISDTVADAFLSKTQAIEDAQIQALAARLENLDDFVGDGDSGELPLDAQGLEALLGIEASELDVVTQGGSVADAQALAAARALVLGSWWRLDYQGQLVQVQYVWRSPLGHLHLFASGAGRRYLIQTRRLAAYLQAGQLQAQEAEPLTLRATRDALGRLQAEPNRLLD